jgi:hypothetical protein
MSALQNHSSAIIIERALNSARNIVPCGGFLHGAVEPGRTTIVNGPTGYIGSARERRGDALRQTLMRAGMTDPPSRSAGARAYGAVRYRLPLDEPLDDVFIAEMMELARSGGSQSS